MNQLSLPFVTLLLAVGSARAQTPKPTQGTAKPSPKATETKRVPLPNLKPCRAALDRLAQRHAKLDTLRASYRQERTTLLLKRPLVSGGTLCFRRQPGCIVFRGSRAKAARIRMTRDSYEVYRPRRQRVERTKLVDQAVPDALFQAFTPGKGLLETTFNLHAGWRTGTALEIQLRPKAKNNAFLRDFTIHIDEKSAALLRIDYRDPQGDKVSLILTKLELDPKLPPGAFALKVPKDAKVLVHPPLRPKTPKEGSSAGKSKPASRPGAKKQP